MAKRRETGSTGKRSRAAFLKRSRAAKLGHERRIQRENVAAQKRKRAAIRAAETKKERKRAKQFGSFKLGAYRQNVPHRDRRKNRIRFFAEHRISGGYGEASTESIQSAVRDLLDRAAEAMRREFPEDIAKLGEDAFKYSGGVRVRFSVENNQRGEPIWEKEDGRFVEYHRQAKFDTNLNQAKNLAEGYVEESIRRSGSIFREHYYRAWIVGVTAYVLRETGAPQKVRDAKRRKQRKQRGRVRNLIHGNRGNRR